MTITPPPTPPADEQGTPATSEAAALAGAITGRPGSRVERARMPLAADVVQELAVNHGVCVRPLAMKVTDTLTGEVSFVDVPCGSTLASKCPTCAERARRLRIQQCREGWHLDHDPLPAPDPVTPEQRDLVQERAELTLAREDALAAGDELLAAAITDSVWDLDREIARAGVRGNVDPAAKQRTTRSTRRRQDAPDLPKRAMDPTTVGRRFTGPDGRVYQPSMFVTLTLPSYGRVTRESTPADPAGYDYVQATRDALHFSKLLDRFVQNLRRVAGYDVQYFAAVEPQKRLAPHAHFAIRGTIPRALLRQVVAATYHQVWWPATGRPVYTPERAPVWQDATTTEPGRYADPDTGLPLQTWDQALAALDDVDAEPAHVIRFGAPVDVQGMLAGTRDADRRIGYLAKYLTKSMGDAHDAATAGQRDHVARLVDHLAAEPCSPTCPNWLRYGIAPKNAHHGQAPGSCRSKAHKAEHLGYAGRRVLVSRKWSGKTLADHKADRRAFVLAILAGRDDQDQEDDVDQGDELPGRLSTDKTRDRYLWQPTDSHDQVAPLPHRLLRAIAQRREWRAAYDAARGIPAADLSATTSSNDPKGDQNARAA